MPNTVQFTEEGVVITATSEAGEKLKTLKLEAAVFDALSAIDTPMPNKAVQQTIAEAAGWSVNARGVCPKAAALLERVTPGYKQYNGHIALLEASNEGNRRFFKFNEELETAAPAEAKMLTRQQKTPQAS